jgi:hypothetical protein
LKNIFSCDAFDHVSLPNVLPTQNTIQETPYEIVRARIQPITQISFYFNAQGSRVIIVVVHVRAVKNICSKNGDAQEKGTARIKVFGKSCS